MNQPFYKLLAWVFTVFTLGHATTVMPIEFQYNQSTEQAFYFVVSAAIADEPLEVGQDWIAAFKGELCVGARQWNGQYTDIPVMGDDGEFYSEGYMLPGEYPTFKLYDYSTGIIYDAIVSENVGFPTGMLVFYEIQSMYVIDDCGGDLGGDNVYDNCGTCDNDPSNDCPSDCIGDWGGDAFYDDCGECSGGNSGHDANSDQDDCGVCFGENANDQGCGCFIPAPEMYWDDADADGFGYGEGEEYCYIEVPWGWVSNDVDPEPDCPNPDIETLFVDDCGVCNGNNEDDLGCGCFQPEQIIFCEDSDGDDLGNPGTELAFCNNSYAPDDYVPNCFDLDPDCSTNDTDLCGICAGGNADDLGCGCFKPGQIEYWYDADQDGFGYGDGVWYCFDNLPADYVPNNVDPEPNCPNPDPVTFLEDDCGVCNGDGTDDIGCGCFLPGPLTYWYDSDGDGLGSGDPQDICLQELTDGWVMNNLDPEPECISNNTDYCGVCDGGGADDPGCGCFQPAPEQFWLDQDGDGFGAGIPIVLCAEYGPENWVTNGDDPEPTCHNPDIETSMYDDCNECISDLDYINQDLGCGCFNPAAQSYWLDIDGDGLGAGDSQDICLQELMDGWVMNNLDPEPECWNPNALTNMIDDCGECTSNIDYIYPDVGCGCFEEAALIYCEDTDEDDLGNPGSESTFCLLDLPSSWVLDCTDEQPDCYTNDIDDCGICGGQNLSDQGCGCFEAAPLEYWLDIDGDGFGANGSQFFCEDDVTEGWVTNINDPEPDCWNPQYNVLMIDDCGLCTSDIDYIDSDVGCGCFNPAAQSYWLDIDGDTFGAGDPSDFCLEDIPEGWVENNIDPEPECWNPDSDTIMIDECGICGGEGTSNLGCGCFQPGPDWFWFDSDSDGLGYGEPELFCTGDEPPGWVDIGNDLEPNCSTNDTDDCLVCGGGNQDDQGCGCFNPAPITYWFDADNDGLGADEPQEFCLGELLEDWVLNGDDPEPDCWNPSALVNMIDDCGVCNGGNADMDCDGICNGDAYYDNCSVCDNDPSNDCPTDCAGIWGGDAFWDDCGECSGGTSGHIANSDIDDCGICFGENSNDLGCGCFLLGPQYYWIDTDGDGLGAGEPELFCEGDEPDGWIDIDSDPEPDCPTNDTDSCGYCGDDDSTCAPPIGLSSEGGRNEIFLNWESNPEADFYNIYYQNGSFVGTTSNTNFNDPPNGGFGLQYDTEYCYYITTINDLEIEGLPSELTCATTYPYILVGLNLELSETIGTVEVYLSNLWTISGYQFDLVFDPDLFEISSVTGLLTSSFGNGTILGYSITGDMIEPNNDPQLLATIQFLPTQNNISTDLVISIENMIFSDDNYNAIPVCDIDMNNTNGCEISTSLFLSYDCNNIWFGDALLDECGICSGGNTDHIENSDIDCYGECYGYAFIDDCGYCVEGSTDLSENYADVGCGCDEPAAIEYCLDSDQDTFGAPSSITEYCLPDIPEGWIEDCTDIESDCWNPDNETAMIDECGDCSSENGYEYADLGCGCNEPAPLTYCLDTDTDAFGNPGTETVYCLDALIDGWVLDCGDIETDCWNPAINSLMIDECGECITDEEYINFDLGCGCFEPAPLEYWLDVDGDGLGANGSQLFCLDELPDGWVDNFDDPEPNCVNPDALTLMIDDCGECTSDLEYINFDLGCGCFLPGPMVYCDDTDGDGLGDTGTETEFCLDNVFNGWVLNCSDPEPDCATNNTDDCGVCAGNNEANLGCGCFEPAAQDYWFDSDNDGLGSGEVYQFCLYNLPFGWVSNDYDPEPECATNDTDNCGVCGGGNQDDLGCGCYEPGPLKYYEDIDGDGFGFGSAGFYCLDDIPDGWVDNDIDPESDCWNPDPNTFMLDECDDCMSEDGYVYADVGCGCNEPAALTYCLDTDGDGLGNLDTETDYCFDDIPVNWIIDCTDEEPDCATNNTDVCGVCGGDGLSCVGCMDSEAWNYNTFYTINDQSSCIYQPDDFTFTQSSRQAFYFVVSADIEEEDLEINEDWIGAFNGDICVGSRPWEGPYTSVPAMGEDDLEGTQGYCNSGDMPIFKIYDVSEDVFYETEAINIINTENGNYNGWENLGLFEIERLRALIPDCANVLDGDAYNDECGECVGGTTNIADGWAKDCNGDCFGEAYLDNCGICSEGNSGHSSNANDLGCGCFEPAPEYYWYDTDGDGLGSSDPVLLCFDDVSEVWVQNGDDPQPFCYTNDTDECGVCAGNNNDMDCAGICFGTTLFDECGVCGGDGTSCLAPVANAQSIELFEDIPSAIILSGYSQNSYPITEYTIITSPLNGSLTGEFPTVVYTPNLNFNGEDSFQFTVSTDQFTSEPATVSLTVLSVNDTPIAYDIQGNLEEDQSIEFQLIGFDIDGDELSYEIISGPYAGHVELIGSNATYTPNQNYFGMDSFDFIVNDGQINSNTATGFLTINSTNDLPVIESIENQETLENESLALSVNATDEDGDYLIYSATVDDNASVIVNGSELNIIPDYNYNGVIIVSVNVTDGFGVVSEEFALTVLPVNNPPEFSTIPSQSTNEDMLIDIELIATDPDEDVLIYSADESDNATFSVNGNILSISLNENYYGQFIANVFVSDGEYSDSTSFTVNVNSVNDAPEFIFIDNQNSLEDAEFSLELFASDVEDDEIIYTASADGNSQIEIIDNFLIVIPNENFNGDINISIFASDGSAIDSESFVLSVNPVNDYPEISIINDIIIDEDNSTTFRILATDVDGDALTYSASGIDLSFEYDDDLVTVLPNENLSGVVEVTVTAADDVLQVSTIFNLIINEVNDDPEIISDIENIELNQNGEDYTIDLTEHFYDVENGNNLEYSIFENHAAIIASVENNNLTLSIVENIIGSGFITITASDNISRSVVSINFEVNVIAVNQPPIVNDMILTTDEDSELVFTLDASDESSELVISILSGPLNGEISYISSLEMAYLSDENYFGTDVIILSISDGELSSILTVNIDIESVNDAPYFVTTSLEDAVELSEFSQLIEYEDIDGENSLVNLSVIMGPSWVTVNGNYFEGSPSGSDAGVYTIMLNLNDGNDASTMEFNLTVINLNEAPVASDLNVTCVEDASIDFSIFVSDNDGDELTYSIGEAQNGSISGSAPNLVYTPNSNFSGNDYIIFTAFDGVDSSNEGTVSINVQAVNDAPTSGDAMFEVSGNEFEFDLSDYVFDLEGDELTFVSIPPSETDTLGTVFGGIVIPHGNNSFTYEHPQGVSDADFLLYKVNDGSAESAVSMITFNLYGRRWSRNNPPTAFDDEVNMLEDNSVQLTLVGFDVFNQFPQDGSETLSIIQSPGFGSLGEIEFMPSSTTQLAQWIVEYIPADNYSGTDEIRFKVQNPNNENGQSDEGIISINISAVNDLPIFASIESINFNEDENTVIEIQFSDVDNELLLDIQENESISVQLTSSNTNSAQLYITSDDNYFGSSIISISISEDQDNGIEISQDILVVVNAINDSPELSNISDVSINEDESTTIQIDAFDIDFVSFSFEISSSDNFSTELFGNQLTLVPSENWSGEEDFTITVEDNFGLQDNQSFNVLVLSVNDTPIANNQSHELIEDGVKVIYPSGSDIESNQLTFEIEEQPTNGTVTVDGWIFTYEPNEDFNGEDSFTYVAYDGEDESEPALVVLNISAVNDAPIFSDLDFINLDEDSNIDVLLSASDIDGDLLVFSIVNAEAELGATLIANVLSISPENNYNGNGGIVLRVSDGEYQETQSVVVNVNPINDSPIIDEVEDISINEGEGAELELSAYDIDGDDLTFSASSDDDVGLSVDGTILTLLSGSNVGDSEIVINVVVTDDEYTDTETFSVFTQNLNDAPLTESLSFEINEDSQIFIVPQGSDPDGDALSFNIVSSTENGSLEFNNGLFVYSPNNNFVGTDTFTYLANDGEYDSQVSTVNIIINNVNDNPVLNPIDNQLLQEGESLELELSAEDIDGDTLTYSAISDGDVVVDIIGNMLTISPSDENFNGNIEIIVIVNDGQLEDSHNFNLTYSPINDIPQITSISDGEILEDAVFIYALSASDVDGDNIEFSAEVNGNAIAAVQGNILTITPNQNYNGGINATVSASDGEYTVFSSFNIQVLAVNDAPIIPVIGTQNAFEDTEFQFGIEVDDIDDADHSFSVSMDTTFVSYTINGNLIVVQPMENWYGEILVSISASDDEFTATQSFIIEFESVNDSPQIVSDAIIEATEDLAYEYQMQVTDPDNDSFYFSLISAPEGMQISENGLITWLPTEGIMSSGLVAIVVWDTNNPTSGQDFPAYQEFNIVVESVNDAPIITSSPVVTATEDEEYSYQVTATDIDSDYFTYGLDVAPDGMTISNNGLIEWLPTEGILSSDMVRVNVSDNDEANPIISSQQFLVVVTPVNDAPIIVSIADSTATTGEEYTYQVVVEDPDDDEFIYILFDNPDGMHVDEMGLVFWIPDLPGIYGPITLAVSDGGENDVQPVQELFIVVVEAASGLVTQEFQFNSLVNLISFVGVPEDNSVMNIFESMGMNATGLIGEGIAANHLLNDLWVGSMQSIEPQRGYWVLLEDQPDSLTVEAYPTDLDYLYNLHVGPNLISYIRDFYLLPISITDAIPDSLEHLFDTIIGEGISTLQLPNGVWVGSLTHFEILKGYWITVLEDLDFSWEAPTDLVRTIGPKEIPDVPIEFNFNQSTLQSFYYFENAEINGNELREDDWIVAYNNDVVVGARRWKGAYTDVPAMGYDSDYTIGYCEIGNFPEFKVYRESTGELINMTIENIISWKNNEIIIIPELSNEISLPSEISIYPAYPNPFNPITTIRYAIPMESEIKISIYDITGRLVEELEKDIIIAGMHEVQWNANHFASGIYFVQLSVGEVIKTQKLMLIK